AIIVIFVVAAIVTPPDIITQILLGIPLILLYEFSIFISKAVENNKKRKVKPGNEQTENP
nr:twin-arginine translocase subunit TatC [Calditrichia bacterium]